MKCARGSADAVAQVELILASGRHLPAFPVCQVHLDAEKAAWPGMVREIGLPVQLHLPGTDAERQAVSELERWRTLWLYRANREVNYLPVDALEMVERVLLRCAAESVLDGEWSMAASFARMAEYAKTVLMPVAARWRDRDAEVEARQFRSETDRLAAVIKRGWTMDLRGLDSR